MNDIQIRCFLTAAKEENFTKAAEKLYMAQPALSRNIATLEQEVGVQLFVRERKSVRLSEAGKVFFEGFCKIQQEYESLHAKAMAAQRNMCGGLIVGTAEGQLVGEAYAPALKRLFTEYPNIDLKISFHSLSTLKKELLNGNIDMALIAESMLADIADEVTYRPIRSFDSCLVVPIEHPKANLENPSITDFRGETFLTLDPKESQVVLQNGRHEKIGSIVNFRTAPDIGTLALWLESGMGISMLNKWHALKNSPKLKFLTIRETEHVVHVAEVAAWRKANNNPAVQIFLNILEQAEKESNPQ